MFFENLRLAFQSFSTNKMRTLLSMLGIVIGVASVIAITTLGNSASESIRRDIAATGLESITVRSRGSSREIANNFTTGLAEVIAEKIPGIEFALPVNTSQAWMRSGSNEYTATITATPPEYAEVFDYEAAEGEYLNSEQNANSEMVMVLGQDAAEELFPDGGALGSYVRVFIGSSSRSFRITGVMTSRSDSFGQSFDTSVYIPFNTYVQRFSSSEVVDSYAIATREGEDVLEIAERLENFLNLRLGEGNFFIMSPATIAEAASSITATLNVVLSGIAAISLLVGGIGIMNIMLVAVAERTREIGVRKALGARPAYIRSQFLVESSALTMVGGIIGLLLGLGISLFAVRIFDWQFIPSVGSVITAILFSVGIGVFFGYYPAHRASTLDPIVALNYE